MRKEFLAIRMFVMFGYNFPDVDEMLDYICKKCGKMWLRDHLKAKFMHLYEKYGSHAVMNCFMTELDLDLQEALVDYAINVYAPQGMKSVYEEWKSL